MTVRRARCTLPWLPYGEPASNPVDYYNPQILAPLYGSVTSGLVLWWPFDDGSGSTARDASGNSRSGTLYNMESGDWDAGVGHGALVFDGTNERVARADESALEGFAAISICAWLYPTGAGGGNYGRVVDKGAVYIVNTDITSTGTITLNAQVAYTASGALTTNTWKHFGAIYNGTNIQCYINGSASGSPVAKTGNLATNTNELTVGNRQSTDRGWAGKIGDFRIYNRALTTDEMAAIAAGNG
jgi:Concanavalin A-like lectin/glucanases superfamily